MPGLLGNLQVHLNPEHVRQVAQELAAAAEGKIPPVRVQMDHTKAFVLVTYLRDKLREEEAKLDPDHIVRTLVDGIEALLKRDTPALHLVLQTAEQLRQQGGR